MLEMFLYNWQIRNDWFEWCLELSFEELTKKRIGGMGSILHNLYHVIDCEQLWINQMNEPATVQFTITIEPDERNRMLRLEADAGGYYRSTEATLEGAGQKRVHQIEFRNLPSGAYTVRAEVIAGGDDVRGMAVQNMIVK